MFFIISCTIVAQGIRENIVRIKTVNEAFKEAYPVGQLIRLADSAHLYALTTKVNIGQTMQMVFDNGWYREINKPFYGGKVSKVPSVNQTINSVDATDWIEKAFYAFVPASISIQPSGFYEMGTTNSHTLSVTIQNNSETVFTGGRIDRISPFPTTTIKTWAEGGNQTSTVTFAPIQATPSTHTNTYAAYQEVGGNGSPATIFTSTVATLEAGYPYFYGTSADTTINPTSLTKLVMKEASSNSVIFNTTTLEYGYYCFPSTYDVLTVILDGNSYINTNSWQVQTKTLSSPNWSTVSYYVYRSKVPFNTEGVNTTYQFKK